MRFCKPGLSDGNLSQLQSQIMTGLSCRLLEPRDHFQNRKIMKNWCWVIAVLICGCAYLKSPASDYQRLVGNWAYQNRADGPLVLRFKDDQTYEVDFEDDGKKDIWGRIEFWQDKLKMTGEKASYITDCRQAGFYGYSLKGNRLDFVELADECLPRKMALSLPRKKMVRPQRN